MHKELHLLIILSPLSDNHAQPVESQALEVLGEHKDQVHSSIYHNCLLLAF